MKIFEKDGRIHLQLKNLHLGKMLFDFSVEKPYFEELRDHIIEHLLAYKVEGEKTVSGNVDRNSQSEKPKTETNSKPSDVEAYLDSLAWELEPKTHCCECTPGKYYDIPHSIHIQYINCKCDPEKFVLKRN